MGNRNRKRRQKRRQERAQTPAPALPAAQPVTSLLDAMEEGREYGSLIGKKIERLDAARELRRVLNEIRAVRNRPVLCYLANTVHPREKQTSIEPRDELPFSEMVQAVPQQEAAMDVIIATPGGSGHQVASFVDKLRPRFSDVAFFVPQYSMSAGTIWAVSGNELWMTADGRLGPIDPQVPDRHGRLVPAQAILTLVQHIQDTGAQALAQNQNPPWSYIRLLDNMDAKEIGNAIAMSRYSADLAASYLEMYKFRDWQFHSDGRPVTAGDRKERAEEVAQKLCDHGLWKVHAHGLSREVVWNDLKIFVHHTEQDANLDRSIRRLWALVHFIFEHTELAKIFISERYSLFRAGVEDGTK